MHPPPVLSSLESKAAHLAQIIAAWRAGRPSDRPLVVGINGPQGSGKSSLADALERHLPSHHGLHAVALSLDDYYWPFEEQSRLLARLDSPLYRHRGNAGTHDLAMLARLLAHITANPNTPASELHIPQYDKLARGGEGDRKPAREWPRRLGGPIAVVLLEGWMLGYCHVSEEFLHAAVSEHVELRHLRQLNSMLRPYETVWGLVGAWILLRAPDLSVVYRWRLEQEAESRLCLAMPPPQPSRTSSFVDQFIPAYSLHYPALPDSLRRRYPARPILTVALDAQRGFVCPGDEPARKDPTSIYCL